MSGYHIGGLAAGLFFVLAGLGFLLDELSVWEVRASTVLALLLILAGLAVLLGGMFNPDR